MGTPPPRKRPVYRFRCRNSRSLTGRRQKDGDGAGRATTSTVVDARRMSCARNVAAVAVIVRGAHDGTVVPGTTGPITSHGAALATSEHADMLFIQRATDERDRWSGHVAFPGGRCAPGESPLQTVVREVHEEIGVDLRDASMFTFVGRLRPLVKAGADLIIHAFGRRARFGGNGFP